MAGYEVSLGTANNGIEFLGCSWPESPVFPGQIPVFSVADNQLLVTDISPNGPVSLQDGDRLFRAAFQATPAAVGPIPVIFDAQFTNLSDDNGSSLPMANPRGGVITVLDGIAPKVEELSVGGAGWTTTFRDYLATHQLGETGFAISDDSPQPPRLPFTNIDRISVRFSEDVQVDQADLALAGMNQASYAFSGMSYDASTHTATWNLVARLPADKLMVAIAGSGQQAVRDRSGNILDGDPAPDAGGDYHARFEAMPGDVDASGMTNVLDTIKTRNLQFTRAGDVRYDPLYDVDGSGSIGVFDTIQVRNSQFTALPQGEPAVVGTPAPPVAPPDRSSAAGRANKDRECRNRQSVWRRG